MNCKKCGGIIIEGEKICKTCGNPVEEEPKERSNWQEKYADVVTDKVNENLEEIGISKNNIAADEEDFNKKIKSLKYFSFLMEEMCIFFILVSLSIPNYALTALIFITMISLILFYNLTKKRNKAGPMIGIGLVCLYFLTSLFIRKPLIPGVLGILILRESISMYNYLNKEGVKGEKDE